MAKLDLLLDEGSFEEFDMFVTHRSHDFGLEKQHIVFYARYRLVFDPIDH